MNLSKLSQRELVLLRKTVEQTFWEHLYLDGLGKLVKDIDSILEANDDFKKGKELKEESFKKCPDMHYGHIEAKNDLYFGVAHYDNSEYCRLLLCFKWDWFKNGQSYIYPDNDVNMRHIDVLLTRELYEEYQENDGHFLNAEKLRKHLISIGLEEKPEIAKAHLEYCKLEHNKYKNDRDI